MTRGRIRPNRGRVPRGLLDLPAHRPLIQAVDHGPDVTLEAAQLGASGDRWIEPFLAANRSQLRRLGVSVSVRTGAGISLKLTPGPKIGAVPLVSATTRRVAAGLLVTPRFRWSALGAVLSDIGFRTEPSIGGSQLVPGSAREIPPWLLAAPVLKRMEGLLRHRKRGFIDRDEIRQSPRGQVDWFRWTTRHVPTGRWATLPCHFSEPGDDPELMAAVRWTLGRLDEELSASRDSSAARLLKLRVADLRAEIGDGQVRRPASEFSESANQWIREAVQAMEWVAEERGLGGSRILDGMSWDLPIDEVWEAWVDAFVSDLAPRCGFTALRRGETTHRLNWLTKTSSMRMLIPDSGLRAPDRLIWVDAKYKAHLQLLSNRGWSGLTEETRDAHRADLHQALAYAALDDVEHVDSLLVYPALSGEEDGRPAIASVASGKRRVRLMLLGLPFGFRSFGQRENTLANWRELLVASPEGA